MPRAQLEQRDARGPFLPDRRSASDNQARRSDAVILLNEEGAIQQASDGAQRLLDTKAPSLNGQNFFGRVHPQTRTQVVHDLTQMIVGNKQQATWLLQLKTGLGPWQWFKVKASNRLDDESKAYIVLQIFQRGCGYRNG